MGQVVASQLCRNHLCHAVVQNFCHTWVWLRAKKFVLYKDFFGRASLKHNANRNVVVFLLLLPNYYLLNTWP